MNPIPLNLVFEDQVSEFVMKKMADEAKKFFISNSYCEGGFGYIKRNIRGFNAAAKGCPFFVLTDLDTADCAPQLLQNWLHIPKHHNLIFRVAVKEVEAWLLADIDGFAQYAGISKTNFPGVPEALSDPKTELFRLIERSRKREMKKDILPKDEFAKQGPNYNDRLSKFVIDYWSIKRAMQRSDSLKRAMEQLLSFQVIYNRL